MSIYTLSDNKKALIAGYAPFSLNDNTTAKDYTKAMSNGKIQDFVNAIVTGALKYGGVYNSYADLIATTPDTAELRILFSTIPDPDNGDGNYIYDPDHSDWQYAGQAIDLSSLEMLANKQNALTADGTGTKYPTVDAVNIALALKQGNLPTITGFAGKALIVNDSETGYEYGEAGGGDVNSVNGKTGDVVLTSEDIKDGDGEESPTLATRLEQIDIDMGDELDARVLGDQTNATNITNETTRATGAESGLGGRIDGEIARAMAAEDTKVALVSDTTQIIRSDIAIGVGQKLFFEESQGGAQHVAIDRDQWGVEVGNESDPMILNTSDTSGNLAINYKDSQGVQQADIVAKASTLTSVQTTLQTAINNTLYRTTRTLWDSMTPEAQNVILTQYKSVYVDEQNLSSGGIISNNPDVTDSNKAWNSVVVNNKFQDVESEISALRSGNRWANDFGKDLDPEEEADAILLTNYVLQFKDPVPDGSMVLNLYDNITYQWFDNDGKWYAMSSSLSIANNTNLGGVLSSDDNYGVAVGAMTGKMTVNLTTQQKAAVNSGATAEIINSIAAIPVVTWTGDIN
jgi:hypothetical protein